MNRSPLKLLIFIESEQIAWSRCKMRDIKARIHPYWVIEDTSNEHSDDS